MVPAMSDTQDLNALARALITAVSRHLDKEDARTDTDAARVHEEVAGLTYPQAFIRMMLAYVLSAERKSARRLEPDRFRNLSDIRAANLLDGNGARLLVLNMHEALDLLADPYRNEADLTKKLDVLTQAYGVSATTSLAYLYADLALGVADSEGSTLQSVLAEWFLDEERALSENND